jgi:excisionase family DNA binding protein
MVDKRSKKPGITPTPPKVLTVREVSEYLRVHPTTIYRLLRARQIPAFHVGSEWRFGIDTIDRWRSEEEQAAASTKRHHKRSA